VTAPVRARRGAFSELRRTELQRLFDENGGTLTPEQIVETARAPENPLHDAFTWDDSEAAERWRHVEAAALLRRTFTVMRAPGNELRYVRIAVSLPADRGGAGYRRTVEVLEDPTRRQEMMDMALRELAAFRKRYAELAELANLFGAIDELTEQA
jgi:hypothetical protein